MHANDAILNMFCNLRVVCSTRNTEVLKRQNTIIITSNEDLTKINTVINLK